MTRQEVTKRLPAEKRMTPDENGRCAMLSEHLDELESDGLITRTAHDAKGQHVEYSLSPRGRSMIALLHCIQDWGMANLPGVLTINEMVLQAAM